MQKRSQNLGFYPISELHKWRATGLGPVPLALALVLGFLLILSSGARAQTAYGSVGLGSLKVGQIGFVPNGEVAPASGPDLPDASDLALTSAPIAFIDMSQNATLSAPAPVDESDIVTSNTPMPENIDPDRLDAALMAFANASQDTPTPLGTHWIPATLNWREMERIERIAPETTPGRTPPTLSHSGSHQERLLDIVAAAEATKAGFDTIHTKAKILPSRPPTQLTMAEIFAWVAKTPKQPHAIGRYQFIPKTLAYLVEVEHIGPNEKFTPELQHRLAWRLVEDAGFGDFANGQIDNDAFMDRLAKIWAGLPLGNGKSAYQGYAGNRATIRRDWFAKEFAAIYGADNPMGAGPRIFPADGTGPRAARAQNYDALSPDNPENMFRYNASPPRGIPLKPRGPSASGRRNL